jgi:uncharacterized protein
MPLGNLEVSELSTNKESKVFVANLYKTVGIGILLSVIVSLFVLYTEFIKYIIPLSPYLFIASIALTFTSLHFLKRLSSILSSFMFFSISALLGSLVAVVTYVYSVQSILITVFSIACLFLVMWVYGYISKEDLTRFRNNVLMGLLGMIMVCILNIFCCQSVLEWITSIIGISLFLFIANKNIKTLSKILQRENLNFNYQNDFFVALLFYVSLVNLILGVLGSDLQEKYI